MRAGPAGEERRTPRYTVPVSPQCPQEIGLPTLPRTVFQGAAISSEHTSQFLPPGNVAEPRCSPPLQGSLEQLVQLSPAGVPFQDTGLATLITLIQFGSPPPRFNGVNPTLLGPEQALVMEREVDTLLRKGAIEMVPPHERESGFYSRYFIVPKKDEGLRPILDLCQFEPLSQQTEVQDAQTGCVSDQVRGLVCHNRSKRRTLPYLHPSHSQGDPEVCFRGRSLPISDSSLRPSTLTPHFYKVCGCRVSSVAATGHPHTQLHQRLFDSRSIRADGGSTSRCCSRSHGSVGVKTERQEECAFSITENHLSWCGASFLKLTPVPPHVLLCFQADYVTHP